MDKLSYPLLIAILGLIFIQCDTNQKNAIKPQKHIEATEDCPISNQKTISPNVLLGKEFLRSVFSDIMKDSSKRELVRPIIIKDSATLIHTIEPILFDIWGEKEILSERPYEVDLFGDYWLAIGSLPKDSKGGTFEILINRRTCEIIHLMHGE